MAILDHWHPVLFSRDLGAKPVGVKLAGRDIALFRTKAGTPAALDDVCPHRRMRRLTTSARTTERSG
jgi:phenylpropionate dioxygenase-like ring-hydroxylating dioxygenase large terminal subunit